MTDWYTPNGPAQTNNVSGSHSNMTPEGTPRGARAETSPHMEVTFRNGESTFTDNSSREYQADQGVNTADGILASARTEGGGLIGGRSLGAKDRVTLPGGMATRVEVAASLGYLQRNPDGSYSETAMAAAEAGGGGSTGDDGRNNGTTTSASDDRDDAGKDPAQFSIGDEGEQAMAEINDSFSPSSTIKAMDEIINLGEVSENTLSRMASQAGLEPHEVAEKLNSVHTAFHDAATSHMEARGVTDGDAFEAFVRGNPQVLSELTRGARDLVMQNDASTIDAVTDAFLEKADRYMAEDVKGALEDAGYGHKSDGKGGLLVILDGGMAVPFQVAVRQKIVTFSR